MHLFYVPWAHMLFNLKELYITFSRILHPTNGRDRNENFKQTLFFFLEMFSCFYIEFRKTFSFFSVLYELTCVKRARITRGQTSKMPRHRTCKRGHLMLCCTSDPSNRHSRELFSKFEINEQVILKQNP